MQDKEKDATQNKDTVGEVGSSLEGGFEVDTDPATIVNNEDMKGKKVDADPTDPAQQPARQ